MESAAAFDYLGGDKVLGHTIASVLELNDLINARFPAQALKDRFQLTHGEFARALGVSEKTVERGVSRGPIRLATIVDAAGRHAGLSEGHNARA
jgi:hypothetical protein